MNANDSINPIAQTKPSYGNEWFEFGNHSKVNLSNHQTTKEQSKVITKQPISSARTFSLPSDATKTCQFLPDHRHFNVKSHVNHLAPITYTNVAPIKKGDSSFIQHNWYNAKYQDNVSNYYRQKLASSKVLFQNSKLKQLDMMDRLMLTQQQSNGKFETDESMRLFLVTTREGAPLFKVIEGANLFWSGLLMNFLKKKVNKQLLYSKVLFCLIEQNRTICVATFAEAAVKFVCLITRENCWFDVAKTVDCCENIGNRFESQFIRPMPFRRF